MQRFTQTELEKLAPGDRFYFAGKKDKTIYTLDSDKPFFIKMQVGIPIKYANCKSDTDIYLQQFKANRRVIFLRNINQKT